jgi:hypothetical protein
MGLQPICCRKAHRKSFSVEHMMKFVGANGHSAHEMKLGILQARSVENDPVVAQALAWGQGKTTQKEDEKDSATPQIKRLGKGSAAFAGLFFMGLAATPAFAGCADLSLVLAIDASGSISAPEFSLQQAGYANAFSSVPVQRALGEAGVVDIAVVLWGDGEMATQVLPWQRVAGPADAAALAGMIAGMPRVVTGNTDIGTGVSVALDLLENPANCAVRNLINVSGDGRETLSARARAHIPLVFARERAEAMGVTINALAITNDDHGLASWYEDRVIVGADAFVIEVDGFESFAEGIVEKLAREIGLPNVASLEVQSGTPFASVTP